MAELWTLDVEGPVRGPDAFAELAPHESSGLSIDHGLVTAVGDVEPASESFDATGCTVIPGFVDCHTHLPFFGWRADEDAARLAGVRYETLHQEEGGIYRSARMLAEASDDQVVEFSADLAGQMLQHGTTTFETKSGYGLSVDAELRQLRLAKRLAERVPQRVVPTCLAAHAIPKGTTAGEWVGIAATELLPRAVEEELCTACDLYVEQIAFALEHAARLEHACKELGLRMRVHADQLDDNQTGAFAARWGFATADHLNHTSVAAVGDLAASDTVAVLLPGATFTLRQNKKPPARDLIESGAIVALGTDLNPGTSPIHSMPFVIALACRVYGLRPLEALAAATVNGAYALGIDGGTIAVGKRADAVILNTPSFEHVPYRPDSDLVAAVICNGELAYIAPGAAGRFSPGAR